MCGGLSAELPSLVSTLLIHTQPGQDPLADGQFHLNINLFFPVLPPPNLAIFSGPPLLQMQVPLQVTFPQNAVFSLGLVS